MPLPPANPLSDTWFHLCEAWCGISQDKFGPTEDFWKCGDCEFLKTCRKLRQVDSTPEAEPTPDDEPGQPAKPDVPQQPASNATPQHPRAP